MKPLAIICAFYKRPELTRIVFDYYSSLREKYNLILIAVGSEGELSRKLATESGWNYYEYMNQPLSSKINFLFGKVKDYDVRGAVWIGSDNLLSKQLIKHYDNYDENTNCIMGMDEIYFYSIYQNEMMHFKFNPNDISYTLGVGRYHSKSLLEKMNYTLCRSECSRGIDLQHSHYFKKLYISQKVFRPDNPNAVAVDIKVDDCMTSWEMWKNHQNKLLDVSTISSIFPEQWPLIEGLRPMQTGNENLMF